MEQGLDDDNNNLLLAYFCKLYVYSLYDHLFI